MAITDNKASYWTRTGLSYLTCLSTKFVACLSMSKILRNVALDLECVFTSLPPSLPPIPSSAVVICIIVLLRKYRFLSSVSVHYHHHTLLTHPIPIPIPTPPQRLVLYLSIASLLSSIVYMLVHMDRAGQHVLLLESANLPLPSPTGPLHSKLQQPVVERRCILRCPWLLPPHGW